MTKHVRIENADTSNYGVTVQIWDKGYPEGEPDKLVEEIQLNTPTMQIMPYLTSTRYFIVKETEPKVST